MRDQQRHFAVSELSEALENFIFRAGVERGCRLIEDEQLRVP